MNLGYRKDIDGKIYEDELESFLPKKIFDFHSHTWREGDYDPKKKPLKSSPSLPLAVEHYPFEDVKKVVKTLFPSNEYNGLFFGMPDPAMDLKKANGYISKCVKKYGIYGLMMPSLKATAEELDREIVNGGFLGFKPYWTFVTWKKQNDVLIEDMVTPAQLEVANHRGLMIMLHIPRKLRLADPLNLKGIKKICTKYPNLKLILAHTGRSYCLWPLKAGISKIKDLYNLYVDTSPIQSWEVLELLFRSFDRKKILFALDLPFPQLKGRRVCVNGQSLDLTDKPYTWSVSNPGYIPFNFTFMAYEEIRAHKEAAERVGLTRREINGIFYNNAMRLIKEVEKGLRRG